MDYIIADTHFNHKNIMQYENRPFNSIEEMNTTIINNWNKTIDKNDKVFHLGDFGFGNQQMIAEIIRQLNGYKVLIIGNHDTRKTRWYIDAGFNEVYKFPIIYKEFYIFSHIPVYLNDNMPYLNIHGHLHGKRYESKQYINACVEWHDYTPISFRDIIKREE